MKKFLPIIIAVLATLAMAGCRSNKQTAAPQAEAEEPTWTNVTMPVRVNVAQPMSLSLSGTATLVRGSYVLITFRALFGIEVATVCVTPTSADLVMKLPQKLWLNQPMADFMSRNDLNFTSLQEVMLGNRTKIPRMPSSLSVSPGGTETAPSLTVKASVKNKNIEATLTCDLSAAKWDQPNPATFSTPGSGYKQMNAESALKALGSL